MAAREYQSWAVRETWRYFTEKEGNPVIAMPTGTGKSHVIALLAQSMMFAYPTTRIQVLTHVKELIAQNYDKFLSYWPTAPAGIFSAGLGRKEYHQQIIFGGIGSVVKHAAKFGRVDILFVDECDLISLNEKTMYLKYIGDLKKLNPYLKVIGLTATAWRQGVGSIVGAEGGIFTDFAVDMTGVDAFNWFITEGYLVPLIPKPTKLELDVTGVHTRGGEFIQAELQIAVDKDEITEKALRETMEIAHDRHSWLIFASGVEHSKHIASMLTTLGVECKAVYSGMEKDGLNRDQIINDFKSGKLKAVVNNNVLTTGFDHPGLDLILMLRPTGSSRLWVQMLGRGTRPFYMAGYDLETREGRLEAIEASGKKNCMVLDFAANIKKLGPINDPVIPNKKGEKAGTAPVRLCTACNTWNHASARFCFHCKNEFVFVTKLKIEASTAQLIKSDYPVIEVFKVDHITYSLHAKAGREHPMIKVTYYCGLRSFDEFVGPQHENDYMKKRAREWWRMRTKEIMPLTVDQCMETISSLAAATHLQIWVNKKYPEITSTCFDGTAFGNHPLSDVVNSPTPTVKADIVQRTSFHEPGPVAEQVKKFAASPVSKFLNDMDDDIPF